MTDREQVIAELQYMKRDVLEDSDKDITLNKAIALLKEQEAVEPIEHKTIYKSIDSIVAEVSFYECANCNYLVEPPIGEDRGFNYCPSCGRKIRWE